MEFIMSQKLQEKIEQSISELAKELETVDDAAAVSKDIYMAQLSKGKSIVAAVNNTSSIDERLSTLITGLNSVIDISGTKSEKISQEIKNLKLKIGVLEEQIAPDVEPDLIDDEDIEEPDDEISDEEKKN
tara:strand:+ start:920 stop:1309 length:390 start_codon:yes stop_codon:yes gene_type:complete